MTLYAPPEGSMPTTGVYQSFNGAIFYGGVQIVKIKRANFTLNENADLYTEVGLEFGTPYIRHFSVRGSITRAYVNGAEWKMAIGLRQSSTVNEVPFDAGKEYEGDELRKLISGSKAYGSNVYHSYPIKTNMTFEVGSKSDVANSSMVAVVKGVMIDALSIELGRAGDVITNTPISWIGETFDYATLPVVTPPVMVTS